MLSINGSPYNGMECGRPFESESVPKGGNVFFERSEYFMGTAGDYDVPNSLDPDGGGTSIRVLNERTTWRITRCTAER